MEVTSTPKAAITAASVANRFKPGDEVSFSIGTDRRVVSSVSGADGALHAAAEPAARPRRRDAARRIPPPARARSACVRPAPIALPRPTRPGTILTVTQGGNTDTQIVETVSRRNAD